MRVEKVQDNMPIHNARFAKPHRKPRLRNIGKLSGAGGERMNEESNRAALCIFMELGLEKEFLWRK
jgi:hypothetical protein